MTPEVTAVITTHGRPACVREAIASVCAETHADVELVVVDDGGGFDDAAGVTRVLRGGNFGVGRARNLGLDAARGEFVIFLDDDDVALPHRIASLVAAARRHGASLCFGRTRRVIDGTAEVLESVPTHLPTGAVGFLDLLTCNPHINAVLVRTETLRRIGGFDAAAPHFDDWSAWLRLADRGVPMWSIADTVAEWRLHARGLTGDVTRQQAMKHRLLALFDRIAPSVSAENARAVSAARELVVKTDIATYDDYADLMAASPLAVEIAHLMLVVARAGDRIRRHGGRDLLEVLGTQPHLERA